eukprot:GFUD01085643.1.p1 GENE.GFUD01085643.1~~GFUD01085643.1.p1  ORF type:complete len:116 (-),score=37.17 GFUD01085643.1:136-483(-)
MSSPGGRSRTCSESSEGECGGARTSPGGAGVSYDVDGKFSYSQVMKSKLMGQSKTTVDENGKFSYFSADMRPVPPGGCLVCHQPSPKVGMTWTRASTLSPWAGTRWAPPPSRRRG